MTATARPNGKLGTTEVLDEVLDRVIELVSLGNYYATAASAGGMGARVFFKWMEQGQLDDEDEVQTRYADFYRRIKEAEAQAELLMVSAWQAQTPTDWKAAATFLARRSPERWGSNRENQQDSSQQIVINIGHKRSAAIDVDIQERDPDLPPDVLDPNLTLEDTDPDVLEDEDDD